MLTICTMMYAQQEITGTVVDAMGPVIGATVMEKGTTNGTVTDFDGNFKLKVQAGKTLVFSYIGYLTQEQAAKQGMTVTLQEDALSLNEVVVTGYTTQRKADLTGAVSVVSVSELAKQNENNPMKAMQGRVPGMNISADGSPSGAAQVRIRGVGTLNNNDPLYIIDGVPTKAGMHELNGNDIESIQVLKDAASASIYGSRAANGVIIITTKKGKEGKIKIDFDASVSVQTYAHKMEVLNAKEYGQVLWGAYVNDGLDPNRNSLGYNFNWSYDAQGNPVLNSVGLDKYLDAAGTTPAADTDWFKETTRTGLVQQYNVSLSNGSEKGSSFFSLGYYKNKGIIKHSDFERFSARMNTEYKLLKMKDLDVLTVGEHFTLNRTSEVQAPGGFLQNVLQFNPSLPVYTTKGEFAGPVGGYPDRENPVARLERNKDNRYTYWRLFGDAYLDVNPMKNLHIRSTFGLDYAQKEQRIFTYPITEGTVANKTNAVEPKQEHWVKWMWNAIATYNFEKGKHRGDAMIGMELNREDDRYFSGKRYDFAVLDPNYMWPNSGVGETEAYGGGEGFTLTSFFGKINYTYDDKYMASFTIRRDGSSRFGKNNRYGTFPSVSAGWRISQENFMKNLTWLDNLKLRASWGQTGNQAIANSARYTILTADYGSGRDASTAYDLKAEGSGTYPSGYRVTQTGNDNIKWETATQYNVGLDYAFFSNSLYGTVDAYIKKVKDMLINPAYLGSVGEGGASWQNGPSLENKGMEFTVGYRNKTPFGMTYNINANLDFFRNKVTYLPETTTGSYAHTAYENLVEAKVPYGSIVGYVVDGLFQSREEVLASGQENARLGGLKYADLDGNGIINSNDQTWIFNPVPDFSYGLNIELGYKSFDFAMFWQGVHGQDVYNGQKFQTDFFSLTDPGSNKGSRMMDAWTLGNTSSSIPALTTSNVGDEGRTSSYFVENGGYLKLRSLQFGYSLSEKLLKKAHMSNARVYVSGNNLLTIKSSSLTCSDPENPGWAYPIATSVSLGIQLGF